MQANNKFVMIKPSGSKTFSIPDGAVDLLIGKVISVGEEVKDIRKGQQVAFDHRRSLKGVLDGKEIYFTEFDKIMAKK